MLKLPENRRFPALAVLGTAVGLLIGGMFAPAGTEERLGSAERELWRWREQRGTSEALKALKENWKQLSLQQDGDAVQRARACKGYGDCLFLSEEYGEAAEAYREALRWDSGNEGARLNLCLAMERLPRRQPSAPPSSSEAAPPPGAKPPAAGPSPQPSESPQVGSSSPAPEDRLLRHVEERERERRRDERMKREKLPPPRGTETW